MTIEEILQGFTQPALNQKGMLDSLGAGNQGQKGMFGDFNSGDIGNLLSGFGQLFGAYTGNKALGLAGDQFDYSKALTGVNLANQAKLTNSQLTDRQNVRSADNAAVVRAGGRDAGTLSTEDYLAKFGVQGAV